ncbi:MAG: 5'/3'-nucleotidase SurE [Myxococcales bacterium]|nr:5'/3'-nucleotidase SurE [Myxococcales bacterium]
MEAPLIIVTNDDGIDSPYLALLAQQLKASLGAEVLVVAPERQRSAMSHAITLHKPLRIREQRAGFYSLSGSPVDCVYVASSHIAERAPALVISGPNDGFNLGTDVFYSGTVGAAVEGGLRGIPSIAVSVDRNSDAVVPTAARLVCRLAKQMIESPFPRETVLNVNVPAGATEAVWTKVGKRYYKDDVQERTDPRGGKYIWIGGGIVGIAEVPDTDCYTVMREGKASVTLLGLDPTRYDLAGSQKPNWALDGFAEEESTI